MTTDKKEQEQKIVTKKHMARLEKEKRQKKILLTGIISIVAVVILLITYGILSKTSCSKTVLLHRLTIKRSRYLIFKRGLNTKGSLCNKLMSTTIPLVLLITYNHI